MKNPVENCPVCASRMFIRELECPKCQARLKSPFKLNSGELNLPEEILNFLKVFIYTEGNIKQSEKLMNCSYPKIKNLLKKTKLAFGIQDSLTSESILEQLDRGEIDVNQALNRIKELNQ